MALLELLMSIGMIIAAMAVSDENWTAEIQTAVKYNLPDNVKPTYYDIKFVLPIEEDVYSGESIIFINVYEDTQHITLHLANLVVTNITLIKNLQKSTNNTTRSVYKPMQYLYHYEMNVFVIYFSNKILPGNYTLIMKFLGKASNDTKGLFRTSYKDEEGNTMWLFATYLQTTGARYLFPCWDEPKFKAKFTISVKHSKIYNVLSNMPRLNVHHTESGMMWTYFSTTPLISPELVAIALIGFNDDFSLSNDIIKINVFDKKNIKVWFRKEMHYNSTAYQIFQYSTEIVNHYWYAYSLKLIPKVDYVAIPDFPEKAVAVPGLVFYREADIFYEPQDKSSELNLQSLIIYNILVESLSGTPSWLKEGFANFINAHVVDKFHLYNKTMKQKYYKMNFFVTQKQYESLGFNFYLNKNSSEINKLDIKSLPFPLRYNKAFSILRMLQHLITDEMLRLGMKIYLQKNTGSISSELFWKSMQNAFDLLDEENKIILIEKMDGWTKQKSYPILKLTRNCTAKYTRISLENSDSIVGELWVPVTYTVQDNPNFNKTSFRDVIWLKFTEKKLLSENYLYFDPSKFSKEGWIIINLQQAGYYRVNYDTENWKKIAKYLNSMEYKNIHVLNRVQIIDDAYHFLMTEKIDSSVFWEITSYLSREKHFLAWYPMIKAFESMSSVLPLSDIRIYDIKEKIQKIFNEFLQNMNVTYNDLNRSHPMQEITKWACIFDEYGCKSLAASNLQQHLLNRTTNKFLPREEWIYCNGLAMSGNTIWNDVLNIYKEESDNKYLRFLACSENNAIIRRYITLVALEVRSETIKQKDRMNSFHYIIAKHANNNIMLNYILANFKKTIPRQFTAAILIDVINHVYSKNQLDKIRQFVKNYSQELILNVENKIEIRLSEIKNQEDYLQILTK